MRPVDARSHLHHYEKRDDHAYRHGKAREALEEESVREAYQVDDLRQRRFEKSKAVAHDDSHIRDDQYDRNHRTYHECRVYRDVVNQICEQQVKREERSRQKEVVHRMNLYAFEQRDDEDQKKEEA